MITRAWLLILGLLLPALAALAAPPASDPFSSSTDSAPSRASNLASATRVIAVLGAPGEPEFGEQFRLQLESWEAISREAGCRFTALGTETNAPAADRETLRTLLAGEPAEDTSELWLVLIGHGTFDGREARFNLRGEDVSATELTEWLHPFQTRPVVVINTTSSSGPFLPKLSRTNRVVITATRSGNEQNFTRFGSHFAAALGDSRADRDQDGQVSLLEAFLTASARVAEFYQTEGRLSTEHALIDDNGDGLGTPADWFRGLRPTKRPKDKATVDGLVAHQRHLLRSPAESALPPAVRERRDQLERDLAHLRDSRADLPEDDYFQRLEALLLELGRLYQVSTDPTHRP